jgi:sulfite exporter TauE/SafE
LSEAAGAQREPFETVNGWLQLVATTAFMVGLVGGAHCAAMCGGIIAACAPARRNAIPGRWRLALAYNAGRLTSYAAAGALAGALGQGALALRAGPAAQQAMLAAAGVSMLLLALYVSGVTRVVRGLESAGALAWRRLQPYSRWFLPADTVPRALGLGALWGWLPCGMVYGVLLTALATGGAVEGALVMLAFGLGTLPNVLAIALVARRLRELKRRAGVKLALAAIVAAVGVLAIFEAVRPSAFTIAGLFCRLAPWQ